MQDAVTEKNQMDALSYARHTVCEMQRVTGKLYQIDPEELAALGLAKVLELKRFVDDVRFKLNDAERTFRPFPGGPKIRM